MQVIFSCENTTYMWWQAELLHYSFMKAHMQADLTALVAPNDHEDNVFTCNTVRVSSYKNYCVGKPLLVLNKPGGIAEWACLEGRLDESVLIVDPDSVFIRPVLDVGPIPNAEAYSEEHDYMAIDFPENKLVIDRHCKPCCRAKIQPVGIYILINRECLRHLSVLWLNKSIEIASDQVCRTALGGTGWLSDMWGYVIAAAELGIHHHIRKFSQATGSCSVRQPIIHYCYPLLVDPAQRWSSDTKVPLLWAKWDYHPWSDPPKPTNSRSEGVLLLELLTELVKIRRSVG